MSSKKNSAILIGIIGLLLILLAGSVGFIVASIHNSIIISVSDENSESNKDLKNLKETYETKIADKTNNYYNLQIQKDSIKKLVEALELSQKNAETLMKYKDQYQNLESKMKILVDEITLLNGRKQKINASLSKKDIPKKIKKTPKENDFLSNKSTANKIKTPEFTEDEKAKITDNQIKTTVTNKEKNTEDKSEKEQINLTEVTKKGDKNIKISISNTTSQAFISKSATNKVVTTKASKADFLKIQFTINATVGFDGFEKVYYFQIIGPKNNITGKRKTEYFEGQLLTYSFSKSYFYNGQMVEVTQEYLEEDFEKGYYFIQIFDKNTLVGKTTLRLE